MRSLAFLVTAVMIVTAIGPLASAQRFTQSRLRGQNNVSSVRGDSRSVGPAANRSGSTENLQHKAGRVRGGQAGIGVGELQLRGPRARNGISSARRDTRTVAGQGSERRGSRLDELRGRVNERTEQSEVIPQGRVTDRIGNQPRRTFGQMFGSVRGDAGDLHSRLGRMRGGVPGGAIFSWTCCPA